MDGSADLELSNHKDKDKNNPLPSITIQQLIKTETSVASLLEHYSVEDLTREVNFHHAGLIEFMMKDTVFDELLSSVISETGQSKSQIDLQNFALKILTSDYLPFSTKILEDGYPTISRLFTFFSSLSMDLEQLHNHPSLPELPSHLLQILETLIRRPQAYLLVQFLSESSSSSILAAICTYLYSDKLTKIVQALLRIEIPDGISDTMENNIILCDLSRQIAPPLLIQLLADDMEEVYDSNLFSNTVEVLSLALEQSFEAVDDLLCPVSLKLLCAKFLGRDKQYEMTVKKGIPLLLKLISQLSSDNPRNKDYQKDRVLIVSDDKRWFTDSKHLPDTFFEILCYLEWIKTCLLGQSNIDLNLDPNSDRPDQRPRLSTFRLSLVTFIGGFLRARYQMIDQMLMDIGVLHIIYNLFFQFEDSSILHSVVVELIASEMFLNQEHEWLCVYLLQSYPLIERLINALKVNQNEGEEIRAQRQNLAHVRLIADLINKSEHSRRIAEKNTEWKNLFSHRRLKFFENLFSEW